MGDQSLNEEAMSSKNEVFVAEPDVNEENLPLSDDMAFEKIVKSGKNDGYEFSINKSRFDFWIKALMLRYWVDFGNQSKYRVNWLKKIHPLDENVTVEIIIHVHKVKDGAADVETGDDPLLFSITVSLAERKFEISEKFALVWKNTFQVNKSG